MGKHQSIVIYLIIVGIVGAYSQVQEDKPTHRERISVLDHRDSTNTVIRRVARYTPHSRSEMAGPSPLERELFNRLANEARARRGTVPAHSPQRPEDHQRHVDRINQERAARAHARQQQQPQAANSGI